nr:hypothetical protein [Endozoicomonas sp.]
MKPVSRRWNTNCDTLDSAVRELMKITAGTHEVIKERTEMRKYQQENRLRFSQHDREISEVKTKTAITALTTTVTAIAEATHAGFRRTDEKMISWNY